MKPNLRNRAAQLRALKLHGQDKAWRSLRESGGTRLPPFIVRICAEGCIAEFDLRRALTPKKKRKAK